jgi:hypothetical protein
MTQKERETLIEEVRREERARAISIIRNWEIYSPYIVGKMKIETRKEAIIAAIWGEYEQDYYSGA